MSTYLSICAIYRDEAPFLREWIELHRVVGVERFFLYNNLSQDDHEEALAPYLEEGLVTLYDWPIEPGQTRAYDHCLATHGPATRWIAFIDLDEFLFSPTGAQVPEVLCDFEHLSGLGVPWALFGTSGHETRPAGLVMENYTIRSTKPRRALSFKSIVDPRRVVRARGPHVFTYDEGLDVHPVGGFAPFDRLRINHYWTKSEAEFIRKIEGPRAHPNDKVPPERAFTIVGGGFSTFDDAIQQYLPAVRKALTDLERRPAERDAIPDA